MTRRHHAISARTLGLTLGLALGLALAASLAAPLAAQETPSAPPGTDAIARLDFPAALDELGAAIAADPTAPAPRLARAALHVKMARPALALADLGAVLAADPAHLPALRARVEIWDRQRAWNNARSDLDAALAAAPGNAELLALRATVNERAGLAGAALADYEAALAATPDEDDLARGSAREAPAGTAAREVAFAPEAVMSDAFVVKQGDPAAANTLHIVHAATDLAAELAAVDAALIDRAVDAGALHVVHLFTYTGDTASIWGNLALICAGPDGFAATRAALSDTAGGTALEAAAGGDFTPLERLLTAAYSVAGIDESLVSTCALDRSRATRYLADWQAHRDDSARRGVTLLESWPVWVLNGTSLGPAALTEQLAALAPAPDTAPPDATTPDAAAADTAEPGASTPEPATPDPAAAGTAVLDSAPPDETTALTDAPQDEIAPEIAPETAPPVAAAPADPAPDGPALQPPLSDTAPASDPITQAVTDAVSATDPAADPDPNPAAPAEPAATADAPAPPSDNADPDAETMAAAGPQDPPGTAADDTAEPRAAPAPVRFPTRPDPVDTARVPVALRGIYAPSLAACLAYLDTIADPTRIDAVLPEMNPLDGPALGTILVTSRRAYLFNLLDTECAISGSEGDGTGWTGRFACTSPLAPDATPALDLTPAPADGTAPRISAAFGDSAPATLRQCRALGQLGNAFAPLWTAQSPGCSVAVPVEPGRFAFSVDTDGNLVLRMAPTALPADAGRTLLHAVIDGAAIGAAPGRWDGTGWQMSLGPFDAAADRLGWGMFLDLRTTGAAFEARLPLFGSSAAMNTLAECAPDSE